MDMNLPNITKYYNEANDLKDWQLTSILAAIIIVVFIIYCCIFKPIRDFLNDCKGLIMCLCYLPKKIIQCLCCCGHDEESERLL